MRTVMVILAGLLLLPASALGATTVQIASDGARVTGTTARDDIDIRVVHLASGFQTIDKIEVADTAGRAVTPGSGCQAQTASRVRCNLPPIPIVNMNAGGGDDRVTLSDVYGDCFCNGGDGNDTITAGDGADAIDGGAGNDTMTGGAGGDVLNGSAGNDSLQTGPGDDTANGGAGVDTFLNGGSSDGADVVNGGDGVDRMDYSARSARLRADLLGTAGDGTFTFFRDGPPQSENDTIGADVEELVGGNGEDELSGNPEANYIGGGPGNDTLKGGTPVAKGSQLLLDDTIEGGTGDDDIDAGGGADTLLVRDAEDDQVDTAIRCGVGHDLVVVDLRDDDSRPFGSDCDAINMGELTEVPNVGIPAKAVKVAGDGSVSIRLACPRKTTNGCTGALTVGLAKAKAKPGPKTRYSIKRGKKATVKVMLAARARSAAQKKGTALRLISVEEGVHKRDRTTVQTVDSR